MQPWLREKERRDDASLHLELEYTIRAAAVPAGPVSLGLEQPGRFDIRLNGRRVSPDNDAGWWTDRSLRLLPLDPSVLRKGENILSLRTEFSRDHDLEAVFLLGEFGVRIDDRCPVVTARPETLQTGSWTDQGLPFYSGNLVYRATTSNPRCRGEHLFLEIPEWAGACLGVSVNGCNAGLVAWPPYEIELTDLAGDARTLEIAIQVYGNRRNSHGPLHMLKNPQSERRFGPMQFVTTGENWTDDYLVVPMGLLGAPVLSTRTVGES